MDLISVAVPMVLRCWMVSTHHRPTHVTLTGWLHTW